MCYRENLWVVSGDNGLYYSNDGMTWSQSNITDGNVNSVTYGNGMWLACGYGIYCSADGITWTQYYVSLIPTRFVTKMAYGHLICGLLKAYQPACIIH